MICQLTCTSHYRMHQVTGMGMGLDWNDSHNRDSGDDSQMDGVSWGWKKINLGWGGNVANFYYRVTLYLTTQNVNCKHKR